MVTTVIITKIKIVIKRLFFKIKGSFVCFMYKVLKVIERVAKRINTSTNEICLNENLYFIFIIPLLYKYVNKDKIKHNAILFIV